MSAAIAILGWITFYLAILVGLALDLIGLFGNWIILLALLGLWWATGFVHFGTAAIIAFVALAVLGEVIEAIAAAYGATKFGGSKGSAVAALVGTIAGGIFGTPWFPIVGTVIGACLGAFVAAAAYEYLLMERRAHGAAWTGLGAALGKVAGLMAKAFVGLAILFIAAISYN